MEYIADGSPVDYHGSIVQAHGRYLARLCCCSICTFRAVLGMHREPEHIRYQLYVEEAIEIEEALIEHVRRKSISPAA